LAEQGNEQEGIPEMHQGLAAYQATGSEIGRSCFLFLLAEVYGQVGQVEGGLTVLAEALTTMEKTDERFWEAELYRLKGKLLLKAEGRGLVLPPGRLRLSEVAGMKDEESPETCFLKAIKIAQHQQAKFLELRAVMSLSRWWQRQGKREEADQMLAEVYGWFTEGFDTPDLVAAKALLRALTPSS
jgi:predicted ATPase